MLKERGETVMKNIITISREFGSGGASIGKQVAEKLGYAFYDRELVDEVAKRSGFAPGVLEEHGEYANARNSLLFYLATAERYSHDNLSMHDQLYITQSKIIEELAEKGKCVIVGRCADYILRDRKDCLHVFICSDMASRARPHRRAPTARRRRHRRSALPRRTRSARSTTKTIRAASGGRRRIMISASTAVRSALTPAPI